MVSKMKLELATNKQLITIMNYDRECPPSLMKLVIVEMLERGILESWVIRYSKKYFGYMKKGQVKMWLEDSDVIQLGYIGIWKALEKYKQGKSSFATFSECYMNTEWQNHLAKFNSQKRTTDREHVSSDVFINEDGDTLADLLPSRENVEKTVLMKVYFENQLNLLSPLQRTAVLGHLKGFQNQEIAKRLKKPRQSVDRAFQRAMEKMTGEKFSLKANCGVKGA